MKQSEFRRMLESQGVRVEDGSKHLKLYYNGKQTTLPRHPGKEITNNFAKEICKQLGMNK